MKFFALVIAVSVLQFNAEKSFAQKQLKFLITNVKAGAATGYLYDGKKTGAYITPNRFKEDVMLIDIDVLKILASYKVIPIPESQSGRHAYLLNIMYRVWYKESGEVRFAKQRTFTIDEKNHFFEDQEMMVNDGKNLNLLKLTYTGTLY